MNILVNAHAHAVTSIALDDILAELGFTGAAFATALNGTFISRDERATTQLTPGDRLEVLTPMQGG